MSEPIGVLAEAVMLAQAQESGHAKERYAARKAAQTAARFRVVFPQMPNLSEYLAQYGKSGGPTPCRPLNGNGLSFGAMQQLPIS